MLGLKNRLLAIGTGVIAFLLLLVRLFSGQARRAKKEAKQYKAELDFRDDVEEMETELSKNYRPHRAEIVNADKDETFDVLSDPDSIRMRDKST